MRQGMLGRPWRIPDFSSRRWANPLFPADYRFREVYLLVTAAEDEAETVTGTRIGVQGWVDCFARAKLKETIFCGGVTGTGEIVGNAALEKARQAGMQV